MFTEVELFLIEMALDEAMWRLTPDSPNYTRFELLNEKVRSYRVAQEQSNTEEN